MTDRAIVLRSPAKLNLFLYVGAVGASGYHPLASWMTRISLADTLRFERRPAGEGIRLVCDDPSLPVDDRNLVRRAAERIAPDASVAIELSKRIPVGAGLGGGSSNAAATLVALNHLLELGRSAHELFQIAQTLGSDVPFFLGEPSAFASGRGERLSPTPMPRVARAALLLVPPFGLSTAAVFRELDRLRPTRATLPAPFQDHSSGRAAELLHYIVRNELEEPAFSLEPRLALLRHQAERRLGRPVRMTGSGSTLFTLFDDPAEAAVAAGWFETGDLRPISVRFE